MDRRAFGRNLAGAALGSLLILLTHSASAGPIPRLTASYEGTDRQGEGGNVPMTLNITTQRGRVVGGDFASLSIRGTITGRISKNGKRLVMQSQIENVGLLRFSGEIKGKGRRITGGYQARNEGGVLMAWGSFNVKRVPND